jgi:hypothetical protein
MLGQCPVLFENQLDCREFTKIKVTITIITTIMTSIKIGDL